MLALKPQVVSGLDDATGKAASFSKRATETPMSRKGGETWGTHFNSPISLEVRLFTGKCGERLMGCRQSCSEADELGHCLFAFFLFECLYGIGDYGDAAPALKQAFDRKADTIFRDHTKDDEF